MLAIAFRFPAGRYHATPWGRHVNEADMEWPPAPWRILRALVATYHRKGWAERFGAATLQGLLEALASELPVYRIPPAVRAHSRHYMPQGRLGKDGRPDTSLVFDGFARLDPEAELVACWPITLEDPARELLAALLPELGYLGRAESWVEGRLLDDWDEAPNCRPSDVSLDVQTGEALEPVRLLAPIPPAEYAPWRETIVAQHGLDVRKLKKLQRQILATLPETFVGTLYAETADLQAAGWSLPPGARYVTYQRPLESFGAVPSRRSRIRQIPEVDTVRLALSGRPLPRIEEAVRIGELVRLAAISRAAALFGDKQIPPELSGHDLPRDGGHRHAFFLPESDRQGRIDHVLVHAPGGLSTEALRALDGIARIWEDAGAEWQVLFEAYGPLDAFGHCPYAGASAQWESATPYLHPWHRKKHLTVEDQIRRECRARALPEPLIERLPTIPVKGRNRRPVHFRRFRNKRGLTQPDTSGSFWRLTFPEPVQGPVALGFGCHFGLGLFAKSTR